jgi:hypothetical protein
MIVVAIVAILAVVAIPKFLEWIKRGKSSEVGLQLNKIVKANERNYGETSSFVIPNGATLPGGGGAGNNCCGGKGGINGVAGATVINKCTGDAASFTDGAGWQALEFAVDEAGYYQYTYTGGAKAATALGQGDVDCDGTSANYTMKFSLTAQGNPVSNLVGPPAGVY